MSDLGELMMGYLDALERRRLVDAIASEHPRASGPVWDWIVERVGDDFHEHRQGLVDAVLEANGVDEPEKGPLPRSFALEAGDRLLVVGPIWHGDSETALLVVDQTDVRRPAARPARK